MKKQLPDLENKFVENIKNSDKNRTRSIITLILGVIMFLSCENDIQQIKSITDIKNFPTQSANNIEILYSDSAIVKLKVFAPKMARFSTEGEPYVEFKKGIRVLFYNSNQDVESSLTANYAIYHENDDIWEASDNVVVVNTKGEIINTELLIWDKKKETLSSDKFVKITKKDEIIYGDGFNADQNFTNYTIHNPRGEINLNKE